MVFSSSSDGAGIVEDIDFLVQSDSQAYPINDKTRNINRAYDEAVSIILKADGRWEFDDLNATDLPIGVTDLNANQQDYSYDSTFLVIDRIEVQDQGGNWHALQPISQSDIVKDGSSLTDFMKSAGTPQFYDKLGNSMFLYPKPSYTLAGGLKAYFKRNISYFVPSDTTKTPGFASPFHRFLSISAGLDYAVAKILDSQKVQSLTNQKAVIAESMADFYTRRSSDENLHLGARAWKFK